MSALAVRGIVEGFYGVPWSWDARHRSLEFLAEHGGNTYVYAPKNDPLHRDRWREPYLREEWRRFTELAETGERLGVDVWFGLSPLGMRLTDSGDVAALRAKLQAADRAGLHRICLLVDDMPEDFASSEDAARFTSLAAAHVALVERVRAVQHDLGADRRLWFVPLHYHGDPADPYVREIGAGIPADVAIMWTGPEVCSEQLTLAHTRAVAASLQRPVLYWDNHPVNDGEMRHDPHLNPLTGRDPQLGDETLGLLANVAIEPEASLVAIGTALHYAADPAAYDPAPAWEAALLAVAGDERDAAAVGMLADLAPRSPLRRGEQPAHRLVVPLRTAMADWAAADADRPSLLVACAEALGELVATAQHLVSGLGNAALRTDLAPWAVKLERQARAAALALAVLTDHDDPTPSADRPTADRVGEVLALLERSRSTFHRVAGADLEVFARWCLRQIEADA